MTLSIIIVNYRSTEYLAGCLQSIYDSTKHLDFEVIVVDSGSFDGCGEMLTAEFPTVVFIQAENVGFARANNLAVERSSGRYILFLNPDTEIIGDALEQLVRCADSLPDVGMVTCKLLNADGTIQTSCIQSFPTILNQILNSEFFRQRFPNSRLWGAAPLFRGDGRPCCVESVSGACMLSRREVFKAAGGFSEDYFMYSEDIDLCYMTRSLGFNNYLVPCAQVIHFGGTSSKSRGNTFADVMIFDARHKFFRKHKGVVYAATYRVLTAGAAFVRLALLGSLAVLVKVVPKQLMGSGPSRFEKWAAILGWSLGSERWVGDFR